MASAPDLEMQINVKSLAHGQPKPYADDQDIYEVEVLTRDFPDEDPRWRLHPEWHPGMLEDIALHAVRAPGPRKSGELTMDEHFQRYLDYVVHVDAEGHELEETPERSETGTVRIRVVRPYCD